VENTLETKPKSRWGLYRWLMLLVIVFNVWGVSKFAPVMPHIQVPAETVSRYPLNLPVLGDIYLTNTLIALIIVDMLVLMMALVVNRAIRKGELYLTGFPGAIEGILEYLYNLTESTAGKWAKTIFPWFATIFIVVLVANWMELFPGIESIGLLHEVEEGHGVAIRELFHIGSLPVYTLVKSETGHAGNMGFVPFLRVVSTDLNFTVALALVSVFMTQVIGFQAQGLGYFSKYFGVVSVFKVFTKGKIGGFDMVMSLIDVFVGMLEMVAEIAKIVSFSFRLFGNIFAGSVLLMVMGSLAPVLVQSGFILFEVFIGAIQALVFGMLTMVFMSMATQSHDEH